ncbi:MAG: glycoside hydrolase family 31 protein [Bacteroidota bacterium]|nr:glycoside hydrolase family 31 protein [Bacteroidota bacterium]
MITNLLSASNISQFIHEFHGNKLRIEAIDDKIIHIERYPIGSHQKKDNLAVVLSKQIIMSNKETAENFILKTKAIQIQIDKKTGIITFYSAINNPVLKEAKTDSAFEVASDICGNAFHIQQTFSLPANEAVYGLGQDQRGIIDYRLKSVVLEQRNMYVANPVVISSRGYGLFWNNYSRTTFTGEAKGITFDSEIGDCVDYYFLYGEDADGSIALYRKLTGDVPMYGKWAFGLWQSKERYKSQDEILHVVEKYRDLHIPLDNIVQDWLYWGEGNERWNSTEFGNPQFPQPQKMIEKVHALNAHIMISVWPSFGSSSKIYKELNENKQLYSFKTWPDEQNVRVYDAFSPSAREIYWKYMNKNLFSCGIDAWWLDATEPEQRSNQGEIDSTLTALGSFKRYRNAFPLATNRGVYENQRKTTSDKRVFILTRSSFAGQQHYGASTWSGDIDGRWDVFHKQIAGGINFSLSGIPYWTTDIGGFYVHDNEFPGGVSNPAYQELYVRWYEFGAFCPLFRSHGSSTPREIFNFGKRGDWAFDAQEKYIKLRYRLLPYIYSQAWKVSSQGASMMRGFVMDYANDTSALQIADQYMFGNSLMVAPVTCSQYIKTEKGNSIFDNSIVAKRTLYLPKGDNWIDFWTGEKYIGGTKVEKATPIDIIPLYVKAGSIIPMGPELQYALEKSDAPLEIKVYAGGNAHFDLYEDEGENYNYEKGLYSIIPFKWNESTKTLIIGQRMGHYPGMIMKRKFNIVFVSKDEIGSGQPMKNNVEVEYSGKKLELKKE